MYQVKALQRDLPLRGVWDRFHDVFVPEPCRIVVGSFLVPPRQLLARCKRGHNRSSVAQGRTGDSVLTLASGEEEERGVRNGRFSLDLCFLEKLLALLQTNLGGEHALDGMSCSS